MTTHTVAVTGANGFVGSALCRALDDAGHRVIALSRTPVAGYEHRAYESQPQCVPNVGACAQMGLRPRAFVA